MDWPDDDEDFADLMSLQWDEAERERDRYEEAYNRRLMEDPDL